MLTTGGAAIVALLAACARGSSSSGTTGASVRHAYGADQAQQFGDLYLPPPSVARQPGVVVVLHGGFWLSSYGLSLGAPLAQDLASRGWAAWNLEYRRVGAGGGWPTTFADVAAGIDALADLAATNRLDLSNVIAVGHSAGGQLAAWAAGRPALPASAPGPVPRVALSFVVSQAGVLDLALAARQNLGDGAVERFLGAGPTEAPERYQIASPQQQIPLAVPVLCVHSRRDANVPFSQSAGYVAAATAAGARASLTEVSGDHFTVIDPRSAAWRTVVAALPTS